MIGGYGNYKFKNSIQKYDFINNAWEKIKYVSKDLFDYRNNAIIIAKDKNTAFIYGGSGNKKGHHMLPTILPYPQYDQDGHESPKQLLPHSCVLQYNRTLGQHHRSHKQPPCHFLSIQAQCNSA